MRHSGRFDRHTAAYVALGDAFHLVASARDTHVSPAGRERRFVYCYCRVG